MPFIVRGTNTLIIVVIAGCLSIWSGAATAQTNAEIFGGLQFNFSTPGTRGLAMGGAALALENEAASAVTNPAALVTLQRTELALECRGSEHGNTFSVAGRVRADAPGRFDTRDLVTGRSEHDVNNLCYAGVVIPRGRWAVALFRHQLADYTTEIMSFGHDLTVGGTTVGSTMPSQGRLDMDIATFGASLALRLGGGFSLGATLSYHDFGLHSRTGRFVRTFPFAPDPFSPTLEADSQLIQGDDDDLTVSLGLLWDGRIVSVGAAYRQGPSFDITTRHQLGRGVAGAGTVLHQGRGSFRVPDFYGLGIAVRPTEPLTIAAQVERVEYSDLTRNVVDVYGLGTPIARNIRVEDAEQWRLGLEYVLWHQTRYPVAVRAGVWRQEEHYSRFRGNPQELGPETAFLATAFVHDEGSETHFTIGIGAELTERFRFDAAADFSDFGDTISVGAAVRF